MDKKILIHTYQTQYIYFKKNLGHKLICEVKNKFQTKKKTNKNKIMWELHEVL